MDQQKIQALLDKYLAGGCTAEEEERILSWLEQVERDSPEWPAKSAREQKDYLSALYRDIRHSIGKRDRPAREKAGKIFRLRAFRVAASLILLAGLSALFYMYRSGGNWPAGFRGYAVERTSAGDIKELRLSDGSVVWLNAASSFRYPRSFGAGAREVFLEGEAFFDIAPDTSRPFIIHTAEMTTRVLGTSFNVQAYREGNNMQVTVLSGKVEVSVPSEESASGKVYLQPNQMATYARNGRQLSMETVSNAAEYAAWREGKLVFNQTPMSAVAARLERAFGLKIKMENAAIGQCKITGRFDRSQSAGLTIEAICKSIEARYTIKDGEVTIDGLGCGH